LENPEEYRAFEDAIVSEYLPQTPVEGELVDEKVKAFLSRPIESDWPYLWIDATYVKARESKRIVSVASYGLSGLRHNNGAQ
jgi:transposase-like protein